MSRTVGHDYKEYEGYKAYKAEMASRRILPLAAALAEFEDGDELDPVEVPSMEEQMAEFGDECDGYTARHKSMPCGGYCRRCLLHDDPGGCLVQWAMDRALFYLLSGGREL